MRFLRKIEVDLTPVDPITGELLPDRTLTLTSTGLPDELRIDFDIHKTYGNLIDPTRIAIYNLGKELLSQFAVPGTFIALRAGYISSDKLDSISSGFIESAISQREGPDIIMLIVANSLGFSHIKSSFIRTYTYDTSISTVVRDIAASIGNAPLGDVDVTGSLSKKGRTFSPSDGSSLDILRDLGRQYGFATHVNNGVLNIISDGKTTSKTVLISYKTNELIEAVPQLTGITQIPSGIRVVSFLKGDLNPADRVKLESKVNPSLNAIYKVLSVAHTGSTHEEIWHTTISQVFLDELIKALTKKIINRL